MAANKNDKMGILEEVLILIKSNKRAIPLKQRAFINFFLDSEKKLKGANCEHLNEFIQKRITSKYLHDVSKKIRDEARRYEGEPESKTSTINRIVKKINEKIFESDNLWNKICFENNIGIAKKVAPVFELQDILRLNKPLFDRRIEKEQNQTRRKELLKRQDIYDKYLEPEVPEESAALPIEPEQTQAVQQDEIQRKLDNYIDAIIAKHSGFYSDEYVQTDVKDADVLIDYDIEKKPSKKNESFKAYYKKQKIEYAPVVECLEKYNQQHVLIIGKPGSGKTSALESFLYITAQKVKHEKNTPIPILLSLKNYSSSVIKLVTKTFEEEFKLEFSEEEVNYLIKAKRLAYLFDGINEIPKQDYLDSLSCFVDENPDASMVFTTREFSTGGGLMIKNRIEMLPLTNEQVHKIAKNYLPESYKDFLFKLDSRNEALSKIPLFLIMLISIHDLDVESVNPTSLGDAFRQYIKFIFYSIKGDIKIDGDEKARWQTALERIAFHLMQGPDAKNLSLVLNGREAVDIIADMSRGDIHKSRQVLEKLIDYHLIISRVDEKIEFRHQMIQEYFAAEHLLKNIAEQTDEEIKRHFLNYTKWTEPLAMMLNLCDDGYCVEHIIDLSIDVDRMLAAKLAGALKQQFRKDVIQKLRPLYKNTQSRIEAFMNIGGQEAVDAIFPLITMENVHYRLSCIEYIGRYDREKAIQCLMSSLKIDYITGNHLVSPAQLDSEMLFQRVYRPNAIRLLGRMGAIESVDTIKPYIKSFDPEMIAIAVHFLNEIEGKKAIEDMLSIMKKSKDIRLKSDIIVAFGLIKTSAVVDDLVSYLRKKDISSEVLNAAIYTLSLIGDKRAVKFLIPLLKHSDREVVISAITALGRLKDDIAKEPLKVFVESNDPRIKFEAITAIGKIRGELNAGDFSGLLDIDDQSVIKDIAYILGEINTTEAADYLFQTSKISILIMML